MPLAVLNETRCCCGVQNDVPLLSSAPYFTALGMVNDSAMLFAVAVSQVSLNDVACFMA